MGINKVKFGENTLIDLTEDTVSTDTLLEGYTAHDKTGNIITGTKSFNVKELNIIPDTNEHYYFGDAGFVVVQIGRLNRNKEFTGMYFHRFGSGYGPSDSSIPFSSGTYALNGYCKSLDEIKDLLEQGTVALKMQYLKLPQEHGILPYHEFQCVYDSENATAIGEDDYLLVTIYADSITVSIKEDVSVDTEFCDMFVGSIYVQGTEESSAGLITHTLLYASSPLKINSGEYSPNPEPEVFTVSDVYTRGDHLEVGYCVDDIQEGPDRILTFDYDSENNIATAEDDNIAIRIENEIIYLTVKQKAIDGYLPVRVAPIPGDYVKPSGTLTINSSGTKNVRDYEYVSVPNGSVGGSGTGTIDISDKVGMLLNSYTDARTMVYVGAYHGADNKVTTLKIARQAGWISGGTLNAGDVKFALTKSIGIPAQPAKTVTPTKSSQTAIEAGKFASGTVTVAPIPDEYIIPSLEEKTVTPTAASQDVMPSSGYDGLSKVTVAGDADLVAENIKKDVDIFGVTGTYEGAAAIIESVSQDQDGYIVFDDEPGTQIAVNSLSISSNGTYIAEEGYAYNPVAVNVPSGIAPTGSITITSNDTYNVTNYANAIVNVPTVSTSDVMVKFYDYDGSLLYSYTGTDFNNLSDMPSLPTHSGLTTIGWNYTLSDAKYAITSLEGGEMDIGATYETSDGGTHLFIELTEGDMLRPEYRLVITADVADGMIIWGDSTASTNIEAGANTYAHSYTNSGNYEIIIISTANLTLGGQIDSVDYGLVRRPDWISGVTSYYNKTLKKVYIGNHVTTLHTNCFRYCINLEGVMIASSVTSLGRYAIQGCDTLKGLILPPSINGSGFGSSCISSNYKLNVLILSNGTTSLISGCIGSLYSLRSITIPSSITSMGSTSSTSWYNGTYSPITITFLNGRTILPTYACLKMTNLTNVYLPNSITSLGRYAFDYCQNLKNIKLPSNLTNIGGNCFSHCYNLENIELPDTITGMGSYTFTQCYSLKSINFPTRLTSIPERCFESCYSLEELQLPNSLTTIGANALWQCGVVTMNVPTSLKTVQQYGLACDNLNWSSIPSTLTTIGKYGCQALAQLDSVVVPSGIKTISEGAFSGAYNVKTIIIHSAVTSIGASAFQNAYFAKEVHLKRATPPTLSNVNAFNNIPSDCIFYVPQGSLEAYQTASNWSTYASQMQEEPA